MPLPLTARKSLRDNEEHLNKSLESIKTSLAGVEWTINFDWDTLFDKLDASTQKNVGETFYKNLSPNIAKCIAEACKDDLTREALIEANCSKMVNVMINPDPKNTVYWKYQFDGGNLNLLFRSNCANINDAAHFKLFKIIPSEGTYSLGTRLNLKNNQEKFDLAFEKLKDITRRDWSFDESSLEATYPAIDDSSKESYGDTLSQLLDAMVKNIEKRCKDEVTCEAFSEATSNGKIVFRNDPKQKTYWSWAFQNSDLVITFSRLVNVNDNAHFDFVKVLPVPGVFSLATRLNIKENQEKINTQYERMKKITSMDWSYDESSLEEIYPTIDDSSKARLGDTFAEIIKVSVDNIEKRCKDETTLEAFVEATANAKFVFRFDAKQKNYWSWSFPSNDLVITFSRLVNVNDNAHYDFVKVLPVPGVFSLATRLNIKENQEKINTQFERLKKITNVDWSYDESAIEQIYPTFDETTKIRIGDTLSEIIKASVDNIEKRCKNDMTLEAFMESTPNAKFVIRKNEKQGTYWSWDFNGGDLNLTFKNLVNINDNAHFDFVKILPVPGVLSLAAKLNLKENQEKVTEYLEKVKNITKVDFSIEESCYEDIYPSLDDSSKARIGDSFADVTKAVTENIVKRCADEMVMEAFLEMVPNYKIVYRCEPKQSTCWDWKFNEGNLVVSFSKLVNVNDNAHFNFEKLL
ncbi:hypothetical protein DICPUDRAFT_54671 [Dictyostelium purpureum]|uniref:Uncharacterized protein n=1 Tax=Dictyostelium purpureum TaxID=5786 RepID=F0ZI50_DICPU|nr:uncharacterized protein DICPUDRAFT_54671 [Dictyostelium purpureum]EGC36398.1 hypothetical protein DICPUDRAFT_54671 [Dictyostelium purpureum]|eukprot:XP_003287095.1 hypothetical protein DICPUDRAFT_54671 [Dictyostelium purpureum]